MSVDGFSSVRGGTRTNHSIFLQDLEYVSHDSFSNLSSAEHSSHIFGPLEKAHRKEQLEKELKVKVRAIDFVASGWQLPLVCVFFDSHCPPDMIEMGLVRS